MEIITEFSEFAVWIIIFFSLSIGLSTGIIIQKYYSKKFVEIKDIPYIPSSLLSPDEKKIISLLKDHNRKMGQKEIGKQLNWSKSKVSAIMSNLQYKEIIKKEKIGRNYNVELLKEVSE